MASVLEAAAGCGEPCQALQAQLHAQLRAAVQKAIYALLTLIRWRHYHNAQVLNFSDSENASMAFKQCFRGWAGAMCLTVESATRAAYTPIESFEPITD
jgi:hypothetical protein